MNRCWRTGCRRIQRAEIEILAEIVTLRASASHGISPSNGAASRSLSVARYSAWRLPGGWTSLAIQPASGSPPAYRLRGQHGVVDAAELNADHQNDRQLFVAHPVGKRQRPKAA
jgi:hypothetical protein